MSEKTNQIISCEVCAEQFTHNEGYVPRVLPCGHTFCESCIEKLKTIKRHKQDHGRRLVTFDYSVSCPRCMNETVLNKCSSTLPKNYSYLDLIEDVLEKQKDICPHHPDYVLDMFCHDDAEAICLNCAIYGQHKTHSFSRLSEFCDHQKTSLKYQLNCAESLIRDCNSLREEVEAKKEKLAAKFDKMRDHITSILYSIKCEVKKTLDEKLESVLNALERWSKTQMTLLDENLIQLNVHELEVLKDKANSLLENASECEIAKETQLPNDIQASLEDVQTRKLYTGHNYELKIDSWEHILETMKDLVNAWNCQVKEKETLSTEVIPSILEKHSPSIESSVCALFSENEAVANEIPDCPFEGIDFTCENPEF
ncbi:tripartite motif-containing 13 [Paramuricea clavata]|uniref:Tripartite motif-containing 13 n=1 Tax=Paramuricea clavata TaxID=317549 RepID=A0A7D9II49_PARCT|nr:tripartite motif-containing 13 [Paramuricea clavata]